METSALTFADPIWFLALILVPVLAGLYIWSQKRSDALIAKIVAPRLKAQLVGAVSHGMRLFKAILILVALALVAVALARPQMGYTEREVKQRGRDILIAIDTSRSMLATDVQPTRLARAKLLAQDLMRLVKGDRIGLIAFAGSSFLQAPLTLDYNAVLNSLDELDTTVIPKGGTNIASAIRDAEEAFGKGEGQTRALVILTDGEELDADGINAAKKAAEKGIRIFTVGIGSGEGSLIPIRVDGGGTDFVRDAAGKPVQSRLDESRLKEIAAAGGGFYQPLSPEAARDIFEKGILPMEESVNGQMTSRLPIDRYEWPLGAAIALVSLWLLLGDRRRQPRVIRSAAAVLILAASVSGANAAGVEDYQAGQYDKAMVDFAQQLKNSPDSVKLQYNAGAAAYKLGDYPQAVEHFTKALLSEDKKLREQASYNLGNSLVRRGEAAKGNDEKKADWKNAIQHYTEALNIEPKNKEAADNREIVKKLLEDLEKKEEEQKKQDQQDNKQQNKDDKNDKQDQKDKDQQKNDQNKDQKDQQKQDQKQDDQQKQDQKDQQKDQKDNKDQQGKGDQSKKDQEQSDNKDQKQDGQKGDDKDKKDQDKKDDKDQSGQPDKQDPKDQKDQKGDQDKQDKGDQGQQDQKQQPGSPKDEKGQQQPTPQPTPGDKKEGDLKSAGGKEEEKQEQPQPGEGAAAGEAGAEEQDGQMSAAQARSLLNSLRSDEERVKVMQRQDSEDTLKDW